MRSAIMWPHHDCDPIIVYLPITHDLYDSPVASPSWPPCHTISPDVRPGRPVALRSLAYSSFLLNMSCEANAA
jgi:hypothetical protein